MGQIANYLENYTCGISNFDTARDYISISHCGLEVDEIIDQYKNGFKDSPEIRLRCYKGYQMESDLKTRIQAAFPNRYSQGIEASAFNGLVKGHPDFMFDNMPADCKTVAIDEHLPNGRVPRKVFWQMQGYMLYLNKSSSLVIYESRATGRLMDYWINANLKIQEEIHDKFEQVIKQING